MKATQFTVGTTALKIVERRNFARTIVVHSKAGAIYLGNGDVTTGAGLPINNGEALSVVIPVNESLYAIDGAGGATVVVLDSSAE